MIYFLNSIYIMMINIIFILISIAFLTLLERKILSYIQLRKGPNKVSMFGLLQPFADAIKLFIKETSMIYKSNYFMYLISPMLSMILMMLMWLMLPLFSNIYSMNLGIMYMMCILSMGVYMMMISGWSSNSMYSLIGSLRSIAQTISYEVSMILILMNLLLLIESFMIYEFLNFQKNMIFMFLNFPIMLMMIVSMLAELNRTPFDFSEGESELVSGFNTEYMSGSFAMIFISEYGNILFMSFIFCVMFLKSNFMMMNFYIKFFILFSLIIWIRGTLPRFRYDNLMYLTWKFYLPMTLILLMIIFMIKLIILI